MINGNVDIKQDFALDLEDFPVASAWHFSPPPHPRQSCSVMGSDPDWFSVWCDIVSLLICVVDKKTELLKLEGATLNQAFSSTTQIKYF